MGVFFILKRRGECVENLTKEELISLAKQGNDFAWEILLNKYQYIIYAKTKKYFHVGSDQNDIYQEALIGFYNGVLDYDGRKGGTFEGFINFCIDRHIITFLEGENRLKHKPLNEYKSLYQPAYKENTTRMLIDTLDISQIQYNPYKYLETKELLLMVKEYLNKLLTNLEIQIFNLYLMGYSYKEIAKKINRNMKSVDNAIQRIRKKLLYIKNQIEQAYAM